jgi:hypothetical protein
MTELKRTKEVAIGTNVGQLLEYALRGGKAARNEEIVPELRALREFGNGDSKYSSEPPRALTDSAKEVCLP